MKKSATVLLLGLAMAGAVTAKDPVVSATAKMDGTPAAPQAQASPKAARPDNASGKGKVEASAGKEASVDPYKVPILRDAKPLR